MNESTIDKQEISKFEQHANEWWDPAGPLKTLHDINPLRLKFIAEHQHLEGKKVLDVGCGGGILTEAMAELGAFCTGIDAEEQAIAMAAAHALNNNLEIDYRTMAIEGMPVESYDVVTCMEMLEHVQNPQVVIQHCVRLLKPGGFLFLSTINRSMKAYASAIIAAEYLLGLLPKQTHDYDKFIKPSELARILRPLDLDIIDLKGMSYNPLSGQASFCSDVSVNYLMACRLSEPAGEASEPRPNHNRAAI